MGKIEIKNDVLAPEHEITREYACFHPSRLLREMPDLMKRVWFFTTSKFYFDSLKWDVTGDNTEFFGQWRGRDPKDRFTNVWIKVKIQGEQEPKTKSGKVTVKIYGSVITEFETSNVLDEVLKKVYVSQTYKKQIRDYVRDAAEKIAQLDNEIRTMFEIVK